MIEILNWFAESGWRFAGLLLFVVVVGLTIAEIVDAWRGKE